MKFVSLAILLACSSFPTIGWGIACMTGAGRGQFYYNTGTGIYAFCDGRDEFAFQGTATSTNCSTAGLLQFDSLQTDHFYCNGVSGKLFKLSKSVSSGGCTAAGTILFDKTSSALKFCDGTNWFNIAQGAADPCEGSPTGVVQCLNGEYFVGTITLTNGQTKKYFVTPKLTDSLAPSVNTSELSKAQSKTTLPTGTAVDLYNGNQNTTDLIDNDPNGTAIGIAAAGGKGVGTKYCRGIDFAGKTTWYLPSQKEMQEIIMPNWSNLGMGTSSSYWTSTADGTTSGVKLQISSSVPAIQTGQTAANGSSIRCLRSE